MKIGVKSFQKAQDSIDAGEYDWAISLIAHEGDDRCPKRGPHHLVMRFDDAEVEEVFHEEKWWYGPSRDSIAAILYWSDRIPDDDSLLIHCTAGKSRSTAVAMMFLIRRGMTPNEAIEEVKRVRKEEGSDIVVPNRLIVQYADELLELDGAFIKAVDDFYEDLSHRIPLELIKRGRHTPEA